MSTQKSSSIKQLSRQELLERFKEMGFSVAAVEPITTNTLAYLLENIKEVAKPKNDSRIRPREYRRPLSSIDKKILKSLLSSQGGVSSLILSKELGIPLSTIQRRRKRLEMYLLDKSYTLKVDKFGLRTADLFISTKNGMMSMVATELLAMNKAVNSVSRIIGTNSADLMAETVFRNNSELLNLVEQIKSLNGVDSIFWIEIIEPLGRNNLCENII